MTRASASGPAFNLLGVRRIADVMEQTAGHRVRT
jgi:hypothetical protein